MIWERILWCACALHSFNFSSAIISSIARAAAKNSRHVDGLQSGRSPSLLQVKEAQSSLSLHSHGVTPDFFEEAGLQSASFDPKATGQEVKVVAGVQTDAVAVSVQKTVHVAERERPVASISPADRSMQLMEVTTPNPKLLVVQMEEAATSAGSAIADFKAEARAALHRVAPSLFDAVGLSSPQVARNDNSAGGRALAGLGLAQTTGASASMTAESGREDHVVNESAAPTSPARIGAMHYFDNAKRVDTSQPAMLTSRSTSKVAAVMSLLTKEEALATETLQAYRFPLRADSPQERLQKQQRWVALKASQEADAADTEEKQREASLEDGMDAVRSFR